MDTTKQYTIRFVGLKQGIHNFTYHIENKFFNKFKYDDFESIDCDIDLVLNKKSTHLELHFKVKGFVTVACDTTNEPYKEIIDNSLNLIVKFGSEYNKDNEEMLIVPYNEYQINISQYIYETIVLALPTKRIHPGLKDGTLKSDIIERLKEFEIKEKNELDPRWDKLNELLTSKKL